MLIKIVNKSPYNLPKYQTSESAGMDLNVWEENKFDDNDLLDNNGKLIAFGISKNYTKLVGTGIYIEIPKGYYGEIVARSSLQKKGIYLSNAVGIIDSDYRGELKIPLRFDGDYTNKDIQYIFLGERVAQLIIKKYEKIEWDLVSNLSETKRGSGGFGST